jgi:TrmH family RNA methyltransferase
VGDEDAVMATNEKTGRVGGGGAAGASFAKDAQGKAEVISSRDNRWLKAFRMTLRGGLPTENGAVGVEGVRLVEEALGSACQVEAVLFGESGERHRERLAQLIGRAEIGFPVLRTTDRLFEGIADTEHPQGVAALVQPRKIALEDLFATPEGACAPLLVVLAGVQDPGNVGTILRTAAAFGVTGAVTSATGQGGTASPYAPKAMRASAGAALHLPILAGMSLAILLAQLKVNGIHTLASCVHEGGGDAVVPWEVDWCQPIALLVGNEGAGLPEEIVHSADARIHIPMATRVESLNAAAAAAVIFYEAYRQRKKTVASGEW